MQVVAHIAVDSYSGFSSTNIVYFLSATKSPKSGSYFDGRWEIMFSLDNMVLHSVLVNGLF
jgi:hypothetical protein